MSFLLSLLAIFFGLYFQVTVHRPLWFTPDFLMIFIGGVGLHKGELYSTWSGFSLGLLEDIFSGGLLGTNATCKFVVGWFCGNFPLQAEHSFLFYLFIFFFVTLLDNFLFWLVCLLSHFPAVSPDSLRIVELAVLNGVVGAVFLSLYDQVTSRLGKMF